jgi:glycosyltransferase involved in cell wall biosynthesis
VRFHGSFIPLHGIETILRAAGELKEENILFELAGRGQLSQSSEKLANNLTLSNVRFVGHVPLTEIPRFIAGADVCLGIFALTPKAQRVIPTKVYEILACGRPLITAHTPAISRVFRDREHALLVTPGDSQDLAAKILELKADPSLAETIAHNGYTLFAEKFQPRMVVEPLVEWLRGENHPPTLYSSHFP